MNLDENPRNDFVTVDINLSTVGQKMVNLLAPNNKVKVEKRGERNAVKLPLEGHEIVILKQKIWTLYIGCDALLMQQP